MQHTLRKAGGELEKLGRVVDRPVDAAQPYHDYLPHLHRPPAQARCLTLSRSRWRSERYFWRAKADLGFDHCEGRSWTGFYHHRVLSALADRFILTVHARAKKNFWCDVGTNSVGDPAVAAEIDRLLLYLAIASVNANLARFGGPVCVRTARGWSETSGLDLHV